MPASRATTCRPPSPWRAWWASSPAPTWRGSPSRSRSASPRPCATTAPPPTRRASSASRWRWSWRAPGTWPRTRRAVVVRYEPLPAVVDVERALEPDAPVLHEAVGSNLAGHRRLVYGDPDRAFAEAEIVIRERFRYPKYS